MTTPAFTKGKSEQVPKESNQGKLGEVMVFDMGSGSGVNQPPALGSRKKTINPSSAAREASPATRAADV